MQSKQDSNRESLLPSKNDAHELGNADRGEMVVSPGKWNSFVYFIANSFELALITIGFALSIYQDDISSFVYLFLIQALLSFSMVNRGAHTDKQATLSKSIIVVMAMTLIAKIIYLVQLGKQITIERYKEEKDLVVALGYDLIEITENGVKMMQFQWWGSIDFEVLAILLQFILLKYYTGQTDSLKRTDLFHYIHHSLFLEQYKKLQHIFFFALVVDTFFSVTIIQLAVLVLIFFLLLTWAFQLSFQQKAMHYVTMIVKGLLYLQLASVAFFQISYVLTWIKTYPDVYHFLYYLGLIFNYNVRPFQIFTHTLMLCLILSTGHFYQAVKHNYEEYLEVQKKLKEQAAARASTKGPEEKINTAQLTETPKKATMLSSFSKFNYSGFVKSYLPILAIWICRFCSIIIAYAYYGYPGFVILTWVLLSFIMPLAGFIKWSTRLYLFIFMGAFLYEYLINVQLLFESAIGIYKDVPRYWDDKLPEGERIKFDIHPMEICGQVVNIIFMIVLINVKNDVSQQRNDFKHNLFSKMANEKRNVLWQFSFYLLKRVHVVLLATLFAFGMGDINIYYIGLLYFIIRYISSIQAYRKCGAKLVAFAAFFIWIQYVWSLIKISFDIKDGQIFKFFEMFTLQKADENSVIAGGDTLNTYMQTPIPFIQWIILILQVLLRNINKLFKSEKERAAKLAKIGQQTSSSTVQEAEFYEEKIDQILTKKFPTLAKIFIRIRVILSEMMILFILIVQTLVLALQKQPSLMYWGFLICSLILQASVIAFSYGNKSISKEKKIQPEKQNKSENLATEADYQQEVKLTKEEIQILREEELKADADQLRKNEIRHQSKFILLSRILRQYSGAVLIAQIGYHFINDKQFLGKYGFDTVLQGYLDDLHITEYMEIIGFHKSKDESEGNLAQIFLIPIVFFITASILKDYFHNKKESIKSDWDAENKSKEDAKIRQTQAALSKSTLAQDKNELKQSLHFGASYVAINDGNEIDIEPKEEIILRFERIRFSIPYLIYQRIEQWRFMDTLALNFHLVTALATVIICTNWQISLFMFFQLVCVILMCLRVSYAMYKYGQQFKFDDQDKGLTSSKSKRDNISWKDIENEYITIDKYYQMNKEYKQEASNTLMRVRQNCWYWQYWLLIISLILMYPSPMLNDKAMLEKHQEIAASVSDIKFWLFWSGIYVASDDASPSQVSLVPLYILITILVLDKISQGWQNNRYGCTLSKIREFKQLEEEIKRIKENKDFKPINSEGCAEIPVLDKRDSEYLTLMEAKNECQRIQSLYREQTSEVRELRLKEELVLGIKRKYTNEFRFAEKFLMEQLSLQLLLFSCAHKSNIISILYLILLLVMIVIKKKATGMRYIINAICANIILEYLLTLTNLTAANSPMAFPHPYEIFPCTSQNNTITQEQVVLCPPTYQPDQEYLMPLFMKSEFLSTNLDYALFFGIDVQFFKVNDMWFDFANILLLTLYFFKFGNQSKVLLKSKVSFSKTSILEKKLKQYTQIQRENKKALIERLKMDSNGKQNTDALTDKHEEFLGPTFYLAKLKRKIFIYNFTKKMKIFSFIGAQILTTTMIFILAVLHRSLMSFGYILMCIILYLNMKNFFYSEMLQRNSKKWINPIIVNKPLLLFSFIDVALQIFYQIPFFPSIQDGERARFLGFDKIYNMNPNIKGLQDIINSSGETTNYIAELDYQNLAFLVLKAMNLFFIFLQARIYDSEGFRKFVRSDLRAMMNMGANFKKVIITYIYNNKKLEQIIQVQQKKKMMYKDLNELKDQICIFQRQQNSLIYGTLFDKRPTMETAESMNNNNKTRLLADNEALSATLLKEDLTLKERLDLQKQKTLDELNKNFKMEKLHVLNEEDPNYEIKKKMYKKIKTKLGRCSRFYLWINKNYVNQILFIDTVDEASRIKEETQKGIAKASNELKNAMKRDINLIVEAKNTTNKKGRKIKKDQEYDIKLEDMPETSDFIKFQRMFIAITEAIPKALLSQSAAICYLFMILSMILNAGLISIIYPFAVFGYALMEEGRPGKKFWNMMSYYTIAILLLKLIVSLDVWYMIEINEAYQYVNNYIIFGLIRTEGILELLVYILPEFIVLMFIWAQQFYEILVGLHDEREIQVEDIEQARARFLGQFNEQAQKIMSATSKINSKLSVKSQNNIAATKQQPKQEIPEEKVEEVGEDGLTYLQRSAFYLTELKNFRRQQIDEGAMLLSNTGVNRGQQLKQRGIEDFLLFTDKKDGERKELEEYVTTTLENQQLNISLIINEQDRQAAVKSIREKRRTGIQRLVKYMGGQNHFKRLFPLIKEQKPGKDLYTSITLWQFIICVYLITYYTNLDARGTQNLENTNLFSFNMVVMLFIQVTVMIIERYISRTNVRVQKRGEDAIKQLANNQTLMSMTQNNASYTTGKTSKKMTSFLATLKSGNEEDELNKLKQYTDLSVTKMTFQQVLKWIIQIVLLVLYHFVIFWLFPLASSEAIYGVPYCAKEIFKNQDKYQCYEFKQNYHLIIFYIIFCRYFQLSALQIRHGYPDWKNPSSLTSKVDTGHYVGNMIFYNLPFLLELKTVLDWCFTKTSLDVTQWLELTEINHAMYNAKSGNPDYYDRKLGTKISRGCKQFCGCFCLSIMLFFLIGPFLFFSNLKYIANYNSITDSRIGLKIMISETFIDGSPSKAYEFPLFSSSSPLSIYPMSEEKFVNSSYDVRPETKFFDYQQVQYVQMKSSSDSLWSASYDYKLLFQRLLNEAGGANPFNNVTVQAVMQFEFDRPLPELERKAIGNKTQQLVDLKELVNAASINCELTPELRYNISLPQFIPNRVRLGETSAVQALIIEDDAFKNVENVILQYSCHNYWSLLNADTGVGIKVEVFSDVISTGFFSSTSIMGFYLGVCLTVGTLFRTMVLYKTDRIFICDARDTEKIRNLIACIYRQRLEQNLKKEEELFFILFEILRSPELFKHLTGSSLRVELETQKDHQQQANDQKNKNQRRESRLIKKLTVIKEEEPSDKPQQA